MSRHCLVSTRRPGRAGWPWITLRPWHGRVSTCWAGWPLRAGLTCRAGRSRSWWTCRPCRAGHSLSTRTARSTLLSGEAALAGGAALADDADAVSTPVGVQITVRPAHVVALDPNAELAGDARARRRRHRDQRRCRDEPHGDLEACYLHVQCTSSAPSLKRPVLNPSLLFTSDGKTTRTNENDRASAPPPHPTRPRLGRAVPRMTVRSRSSWIQAPLLNSPP